MTTQQLLISIKPKYWERIADGSKRIEFRRGNHPRNISPGDRAIVYASSPVSAIVGSFMVDSMELMHGLPTYLAYLAYHCHSWHLSGVSCEELEIYYDGAGKAWAILFDDVTVLDDPIPLPDGMRPPQSWMYATDEIIKLTDKGNT